MRPRCGPTRPRRPPSSSTPCTSGRRIFKKTLGRRLVYAADEYYLLADRPFPPPRAYDEFPQHENGIGMARAFQNAFTNPADQGPRRRAPRLLRLGRRRPGRGLPRPAHCPSSTRYASPDPRPVTVLTGTYGARILRPLLGDHPRHDITVQEIANDFFGGNIGVAGLLTGEDIARALATQPRRHPLPPARRLPQRGPFPRRPHPGRPAPTRRSGPDRWHLAAGRPRRHLLPISVRRMSTVA